MQNVTTTVKRHSVMRLKQRGSEVLMVFEDLDSTGFAERLSSVVNWDNINACLHLAG